MARTIRIKTAIRDGVTTIRCIIKHPMHTGFGVDPETQEIIPAHYIKNLYFYHQDELIMECNSSRAVSRNPYFSFRFRGAKAGDVLKVHWTDNQNKEDQAEFVIQ